MNRYRNIFTIGLISFLLTGCSPNPTVDEAQQSDQIEITKITSTNFIDQQPSNQAKDLLRKYDGTTAVKAVNTSKTLLIAIEVKHRKRFNLADIRKKLTKEMKESFPDINVELSTDKKIILEIDQLEKDLQSKSISNKKLDKAIKNLVKLSKEET